MNTQKAAEIRMRALRQITRDCVSVHITSRQVEDLACAYLNAQRRLAEIHALCPGALQSWAENYNREKVRAALVEIERLSELPIDKQADP